MFVRPPFAEADASRIRALIETNPFGVLVTHGSRGLEATHLPFALRAEGEEFILAGHLAAGNPQREALEGGRALAIFSGPHAYISPGWYGVQPSVPTWDYAAVHVTGSLALVTDPEAIAAHLQDLAAFDPHGFTVGAMEPGYRARMIAGVRAFRLRPERIEAQWKMSQNRSAGDRLSVIAALREQGDPMSVSVAALIAETLPGEGS